MARRVVDKGKKERPSGGAKQPAVVADQPHRHEWSFFSNHMHVLHCISVRPDLRIRDIALRVGITERAVQRIVVDLEREGYIKRERVGRQNRYRFEPSVHLRHPLTRHIEVGQFLAILQSDRAAGATPVAGLLDAPVQTAQKPAATLSPADAKVISPEQQKSMKQRKDMVKKPV